MLTIKNLSVSVDTQHILKNCSLHIEPGQVHVLMGPNGSGKSSLAYTLMGHPLYQVKNGSICFNGNDITALATHDRAKKGFYLCMQQPCSISGLQVLPLLRELYKIHRGQVIDDAALLYELKPLLEVVGLSESMLYRSVNDHFSGGEKKRFELLQMMLLKPQVAILDEIDSGVDVDGLKLIASGLQKYKEQNPQASIIIVTHYRRILQHLTPDVVHVMHKGTIVDQGDNALIDMIEHKGYEQYARRVE